MKKSRPSVSIVIPVVNERANLRRLLAELAVLKRPPDEVIVVDGDSTDGTPDIALKNKAHLISSVRGRGCQILNGVTAASGDIALVLHADMELEGEVVAKVAQAMGRRDAPGGAVGNRFGTPSKAMKVVEWMNHWRARYFRLSFGDQGQFFRRERALAEDWIQPYPVMEDLELSLRMKKAGKPLYLQGGIRSSTRRWDRKNKILNFLQLLSNIFRYRWAPRDLRAIISKRIYREYYHEDPPGTRQNQS